MDEDELLLAIVEHMTSIGLGMTYGIRIKKRSKGSSDTRGDLILQPKASKPSPKPRR
jgi:hypothetical protein